MKKIYRFSVLALAALMLLFGLTACGGPTEEQTAKMESLLNQLDATVSDCEAAIATYPANVEDATYKDILAQINETMETIKTATTALRKTYNESKDNYDEEKADEVIKVLDDQLTISKNFLRQIKDNVAEVEVAVAATAGQ